VNVIAQKDEAFLGPSKDDTGRVENGRLSGLDKIKVRELFGRICALPEWCSKDDADWMDLAEE
jgi:hypothetical protein